MASMSSPKQMSHMSQPMCSVKSSVSAPAFVLRLPDHQKELHQFVWQLFDDQIHTDVTLALDDGQYIKAHKLILSAFSPYFKQVLTRISNPLQYPVIIVKDMVYEDLRSLIEFMYRGSTTVANDRLPQVLKCAKQLKIRGLYETNSRNSNEFNRNESRITPTVQTIAPTITETIETKLVTNDYCNRKLELNDKPLVGINSYNHSQYINEWFNKKLVAEPPKFISPVSVLTDMQQKMALDLTKRIGTDSERPMFPMGLCSNTFTHTPHQSLFRSTSVDDSRLNQTNVIVAGKRKRAPSSLDGHLDSNKINDSENNSCKKEKKRSLNIFHAAKYRNRKKHQLEVLFQEENELQHKNSMAKLQIDKLESTIHSLIWQQTKKNYNCQTVFTCPVCGNAQSDVPRLRSHINMLHNDTEALMKFLMIQRSPNITSTMTSAMTSSQTSAISVPLIHNNVNIAQ